MRIHWTMLSASKHFGIDLVKSLGQLLDARKSSTEPGHSTNLAWMQRCVDLCLVWVQLPKRVCRKTVVTTLPYVPLTATLWHAGPTMAFVAGTCTCQCCKWSTLLLRHDLGVHFTCALLCQVGSQSRSELWNSTVADLDDVRVTPPKLCQRRSMVYHGVESTYCFGKKQPVRACASCQPKWLYLDCVHISEDWQMALWSLVLLIVFWCQFCLKLLRSSTLAVILPAPCRQILGVRFLHSALRCVLVQELCVFEMGMFFWRSLPTFRGIGELDCVGNPSRRWNVPPLSTLKTLLGSRSIAASDSVLDLGCRGIRIRVNTVRDKMDLKWTYPLHRRPSESRSETELPLEGPTSISEQENCICSMFWVLVASVALSRWLPDSSIYVYIFLKNWEGRRECKNLNML